MIFYIFLAVCVISWIIYVCTENGILAYQIDNFCPGMVALPIAVISTIVLFFMTITIVFNSITFSANFESAKLQYNQLRTQYENITESDDFNKNILINEIMNWNIEIVQNQKLNENTWIGIFIPDYYDDLELIELEK